jgi:hypothetical protein
VNVEKNERQARRMAKEKAALARKAKEGKSISTKDQAKLNRDLRFDNVEEQENNDDPRRS